MLSLILKCPLNSSGRDSDVSLVELAGTVKDDDRAVLLEGGGLQSVSHGVRNSSVTTQFIRFVRYDLDLL